MEDQSKFTSPAWEKYVKAMLDRELSPIQEKCNHSYMRLPKSGGFLGHLAWRCVYCDTFVQSS